jgi:hypothetical protein
MGKRVHGNGVIKTIDRSVSPFQEVEANGDIKLLVTQGDLQSLKIQETRISYHIRSNSGRR